jgi:two-component system cell cycle response regulator
VSGPRVLVVDDSEVTRTLLVRTLERAGFAVISAKDGAEGAVVALKERPAVVVTDLEMPLMDGYQLLRLLKHEPASASIPVLILTSHGEAPSRFWGLHTGADAYLTKNYDSAELVSTVSRLARQAAPSPPPGSVAPTSPLEVLARVAHQLDATLLRTTLVNALLEKGLQPADVHGANQAAAAVVAEVVDADLLAVALAEPDTVTLDLVLGRPLSLQPMERCASAVLAALNPTPGVIIDTIVTGEQDGVGTANPDELAFFPLPLRGAGGVLAVLPRDPQQFASLSRPLVESLVPHLALVLDNARLAQRLHELSTIDGLTRALNHRAIHERLGEELERASRYHHPVTVVLADLDFFKRVNDTHGHLTGDAVLRGAALAMRRTLRDSDALGRYGGEEFLALLPETELEAGRQAAERLRRGLSTLRVPLPGGETIGVTASFGVAAATELGEGVSADSLVTLADTRLYQAKSAGRNCVRP